MHVFQITNNKILKVKKIYFSAQRKITQASKVTSQNIHITHVTPT